MAISWEKERKIMKVVILAGGFGTRISEESYLKPKPMLEIGGKPILWHIMKEYSHYGFNEFIICCGYKQHVIKEWFADYYLYNSDVTFDFSDNNKMTVHNNVAEPWKVTLVDTGLSMNVAAAEITRCVLERDDKVRILDADALNIIAGEHIDYKGSREGQIIITPHIMEMSRLTGKTVADIKEHMIESAKEYAIQHSCICILKDARTVVTDGQKVYINCTGNDGMSTGGCGDVLTGLIAGMTAMGLDAFEAACLSVYVHGKAGDYAASGKGRAGMTAADVSEAIAYVLKR